MSKSCAVRSVSRLGLWVRRASVWDAFFRQELELLPADSMLREFYSGEI